MIPLLYFVLFLNLNWLSMPNIFIVLPHSTVRSKEAGLSHIDNRHPKPLLLVLIQRINLFLGFNIAIEILQDKIIVMV